MASDALAEAAARSGAQALAVAPPAEVVEASEAGVVAAAVVAAWAAYSAMQAQPVSTMQARSDATTRA